MLTTRRYTVAQLEPYIDWGYFLHAWQMPVKYASLGHLHQCESCRGQWLSQYDAAELPAATEAMHLVDDARQMLARMESMAAPAAQNSEHKNKHIEIIGRVGLFAANSDGDDILIAASGSEDAPAGGTTAANNNKTTSTNCENVRIPCLRQQHCNDGAPNLCLADFIRPKSHGICDRIGVFATSVGANPDELYPTDAYYRMLVQTLCDRLAEAAACLLHKEVRSQIWGYSPDEDLTIEDLLRERNQGIRPAVGYPSLPDQSICFILQRLIAMNEIGIALTENGAMTPHASVCGLMISHPKSRYFAVGKIDAQQLCDYAARRQLPLERIRQFLAGNL